MNQNSENYQICVNKLSKGIKTVQINNSDSNEICFQIEKKWILKSVKNCVQKTLKQH